jgi:hypothetical protein
MATAFASAGAVNTPTEGSGQDKGLDTNTPRVFVGSCRAMPSQWISGGLYAISGIVKNIARQLAGGPCSISAS